MRRQAGESLDELSGQTICAPAGSTSLDNLSTKYPKVDPDHGRHRHRLPGAVPAGQGVGITGDDTVLAGQVAQDPYARVSTAPAFSDEPYGLGMNAGQAGVRPVRERRARADEDGRPLAAVRTTSGSAALGKLTTPPAPVYGRVPPS